MATIEELLAGIGNDDFFTIDLASRAITVPSSVTNIGVESDDDVTRLYFKLPRRYHDNDFNDYGIRINYLNGNNEGDIYKVENVVVDDDYITFDWLVGRNAVAYKGNVKFVVCLKKTDEDGTVLNEFNTTVCSLPVKEGLETTEAVVQENADIIEQILAALDGYEPGTGGGGGSIDLTFDDTPTEGSSNPVTSDGIYKSQKAIMDSVYNMDTIDEMLIAIGDTINDKAVKTEIIYADEHVYDGVWSPQINNKEDRRCLINVVDMLDILLAANLDDGVISHESSIFFTSGNSGTNITVLFAIYDPTSPPDQDVRWVGDDCNADGEFTPVANTSYEISFKYMGVDANEVHIISARVGAC